MHRYTVQGSYTSWQTWKILEFDKLEFQALNISTGVRSWKILEYEYEPIFLRFFYRVYIWDALNSLIIIVIYI